MADSFHPMQWAWRSGVLAVVIVFSLVAAAQTFDFSGEK